MDALGTVLDDVGLAALAGACAIVFLAAMVQASVGMGFGQVAGPSLLLIDPRFVPGPVIAMAIVVGAARVALGW